MTCSSMTCSSMTCSSMTCSSTTCFYDLLFYAFRLYNLLSFDFLFYDPRLYNIFYELASTVSAPTSSLLTTSLPLTPTENQSSPISSNVCNSFKEQRISKERGEAEMLSYLLILDTWYSVQYHKPRIILKQVDKGQPVICKCNGHHALCFSRLCLDSCSVLFMFEINE
ncbi:hypothetical protein GQ43DRAFT_76147 [Delitschia confertaspora ATCC 74209]|uniref:Uncharacterized protein n=1 Tax=Delitschia confertaspora ATCC 74209 TaxID=1513339 RepID=A0A9P4MTA9_9PLEO|nr:hypothetical protein GQ43DRAFT_76147 [Delitschia confertaspora ATCC 74209]